MTDKVSKDMDAKVRALVQKMFDYLCEKNGVKPEPVTVLINLKSAGKQRSRGGRHHGKPWTSFRFSAPPTEVWRGKPVFRWIEYKSIGKKPSIGDIPKCTYTTYIYALVAHEVAHAFDYHVRAKWHDGARVHKAYCGTNTSREIGNETGHSLFWQKIYRDLRVKYVNKQTASTFESATVEQPKAKKVKTAAPTTTIGTATCKTREMIRVAPGQYWTVPVGRSFPIVKGVVTNKKGTYFTIQLPSGKQCRVNPDWWAIA